MTSTPPASAALLAVIERTFGFVPPFFGPAIDTPDVLENLWQQTRTAYVENPLPALFKEMLSAYLSRYCNVSYCLVCHACTLRPLGMSGPDVLRLLQTPLLTDGEARALIAALDAEGGAPALPSPGSWQESAVISLSSAIYLAQPVAAEVRTCLRRILGPADHNRVIILISYVKSCHSWVESHPEVSYLLDTRYQKDYQPLAEEEPGLHRYFQDHLAAYGQAQRSQAFGQSQESSEARISEAAVTIELLEKRLMSVLDERRQAANFAQELVAIVSHDLRNPLTAILLSARIVVGTGSADERVVRAAHRIISSAQRATRLVGSLLDFTQARVGGGISVRPAPADMHALVRTAVDELLAAHPRRTILCDQQGNGAGEWDADRISQVLGNIMANAIAYSPEGSAVKVTTYDDNDACVIVEVHNLNREGPIAADLLPVLFEPYKQGKRHTSENKSIGLGLHIVHSIVLAHRGQVTARSTEQGTTLRVTLPRSPAAPDRTAASK